MRNQHIPDIWQAPCPVCGSRRGQPCTDSHGRPRPEGRSHSTRSTLVWLELDRLERPVHADLAATRRSVIGHTAALTVVLAAMLALTFFPSVADAVLR